MRKPHPTIVSLGLLAGLPGAASASINFDAFTGNGAPFLSTDGQGLLKFEPDLADAGSGSYTGTFLVTSDTPLTNLDVQVGSNVIYGGSMSFTVSLNQGIGFAYRDAVTDDGSSLMADGGGHALAKNDYMVGYALAYTGDEGSFSSFTLADFNFHTVNPVPEPASLAALGIGAIGLVRCRRKG